MRCKLVRHSALWIAGLATLSSYLPGCGGGGGGGGPSNPGNVFDPLITMQGPTGRLSRTIDEANADNGATPPPSLPPIVTTDNHWFRLEFPYAIDPTSILENNPLNAPFSYLNGNVTVTDTTGDHIPGMALINGRDVFGLNHANDAGFPHDIQGGVDKNLGKNVFLYVADIDRNLSTIAAFGYDLGGSNQKVEITNVTNHQNGTLDTVRVTVATVNGQEFNAVWTFHIGATADTRPPFVVRIDSETKDPTQPLNQNSAASETSFVLEFSEPMVPKSVGRSSDLNGVSFTGNIPLVPIVPPLPNVSLSATVNTASGILFIPFDCSPLNSNNLATYRLDPLIDLPGDISIDLIVRALTANTNTVSLIGDSAIDLAGNNYDGQDLDLNGVGDGLNLTKTFEVGPGAGLVNAPVSPEVIYWLPSAGDGIGAIDLNGRGLNTNSPGANVNNRDSAVLITKNWLDQVGCEINPGGLNLTSGIGLWGYPGHLPPPLDPCTGAPMIEFAHNQFHYPVGLGGFAYGPVANPARGDPWYSAIDQGNPGTAIPGVNEGSSGFETLCRDSKGDVILTGSQFGRVGVIHDLIVGEFLDVTFRDIENSKTVNNLQFSFFNGGQSQRGNSIADPPTPNPPPLRYWAGLPTLGVSLDQSNPNGPALLLEGEEVFAGFRYGLGYQQLQQNENNPNAPDQTLFPHFASGPGPQSATQVFTFSSRQQVGNYLYATDITSKEVHAINSNTMRVITSIPLPDPTGLAIAPDLKRVYVTNFAFDNVSVLASDPFGSDFHQEIARISVGQGPRSICVQPDNEDILVCNFGANSVSIISAGTYVVRKTFDSLISQPWDIEATPRQIDPNTPSIFAPNTIGFGAGIYFAYVSNFGSNSLAVYESGPDGPQGIGLDNVRGAIPTSDQEDVLVQPRGLCASPLPNPQGFLAGGCFVAHKDEEGFGRVSHCQFTQQALFGPIPIVSPPGSFIPPGFTDRQFEVTGRWGHTDSTRLLTSNPIDVALCDMSVTNYQNRPSTAPNFGCSSVPPDVERTGAKNSKSPVRLAVPACFSAITPDRLYVAYEDRDSIQVLSLGQAGQILNTIPGPGNVGVKKLMSYWKQ